MLLCICMYIIYAGVRMTKQDNNHFYDKNYLKKRWCLGKTQADEEEVYRAVSGCLSATAAVSWPTKPQGDLRNKTAACR